MSGMGTSGQNAATTSQTAPWGPAQGNLLSQLKNAGGVTNYGAPSPEANALWTGAGGGGGSGVLSQPGGGAAQAAANIPAIAPAATALGKSFMTGDPTGELKPALQSYQNTMNPIANMSADPTKNPATAALLQAIQDQTTQSINGQFAGAGRSLSGYNQKDLAMGLSEGMAPTLFNQYNQNLSNIQNASQGLLSGAQTTQGLQNANQQAGLQLGASAFPLSQLPAQTIQGAWNQPGINQAQMAGLGENLTIPIAGLGGQTAGTMQGTANASPLTQLGQIGNLFGTLV